jgi:hypothetical protein
MPAQLGSSNAIDRGGSGETPDVGSKTFRLVPSIPRGPAVRFLGRLDYYQGGPPRCPECRTTARHLVRLCGYHSNIQGNFHCLRCKVAWFDTDDVECFICGDVYRAEPDRIHGAYSKRGGTYYHGNRAEDPFCHRCRAIIGRDIAHSRRQLRRMVGLRTVH